MGRQPGGHPAGDELDQRRVGDDKALSGALVPVLLVALPELPEFDSFECRPPWAPQ